MVMKPRDRKLFILRQLGQEAEPVTLAELSEKLGLEFTFRTLRRWLNQLIKEGLIQKLGHTKGAKYVAVRATSRNNEEGDKTRAVSSCFSTDSLNAIRKISRPLFEREPVSYSLDWFESYDPNTTFYLTAALREQLAEAGRRANGLDPAGTYAHQIFHRLIIDLSYNSSRLEGNTYSLLDTERLLLHGDTAQGKLDEEKVMILNHKEAIRYLVDDAPRLEVNRNLICTLHYLLSDGLVEPLKAGKVNKYGVRIRGSTYIPFEDPRRLEQQLEKMAAKAAAIEDPYEQSIFLLIHVSYLQAFIDVNKRTARLSANTPLIKGNLVPIAFTDIEVFDYRSAMIAVYELQDVRPIVDLYVYSYMRTCAAYDSTVKAMGFDEVRVRYRQQRRAMVREVIVRCLAEREMNAFVVNEAILVVPEAVREAFVVDVLEDLEQMDESRLVGLGVTPEQLRTWMEQLKL
jgi:hypothetical protein